MAAWMGLIVLSMIVTIIGIGLSAGYMLGYLGTTQGEVDTRMNECLGIVETGNDIEYRQCFEDAGIYSDVDCEMYPNMPACGKVEQFFQESRERPRNFGSSGISPESPAPPESQCSPDCRLKIIAVGEGTVAEYLASNTQIPLETNGIIRIEAADDGAIRGLRVLAKNLDTNDTQVLRRINDSIYANEYRVNLNGGNYELQARVTWADETSSVERFSVAVS